MPSFLYGLASALRQVGFAAKQRLLGALRSVMSVDSAPDEFNHRPIPLLLVWMGLQPRIVTD